MRLDSQAPDCAPEPQPELDRLLALYAAATATDRRVSILQEVARLCEVDMGDPAAAWAALVEALDEDVDFGPVGAELERLSERLQRWGDLVEHLVDRAGALEADDPERAADTWVRLARWYDDPIGQRDYAMSALRSALRCCDEHEGALAVLADIARAEERWPELARLLERRVVATNDPEIACEGYVELGELYEGPIAAPERAVRAYRGALASGVVSMDAVFALERLYRASNRMRDLVDVLSARADLADSEAERVCFELERARIAELVLDEIRPPRIEDWHEAVQILAVVADCACTRSERADVWWQRGRIELTQLGDRAAAEHSFAEAIVHEKGHVPSLLALVQLNEERGDWAKAVRYLADAARVVDTGVRRAELFERAAEIAHTELDDVPLAIRYYERVRMLDPDNIEAMIGLAELYLRAKRWREAMPLLSGLIAAAREREIDDETRAQLECQAGQCEAAQGHADEAIARFETACLLDPGSAEACELLADALFDCGRWRHAAEAYDRLIEIDPDAGARARVRLGEARAAIGETVKAFVAFHGALRIEPGHANALSKLAALHAERAEWDSAVRAMRAELTGAPTPRRLALLREIASVHRDKLRDPDGAIDAYREAAMIEPLSHRDLQALLDLYTDTMRWRDAIAVIETFAGRERDAMRRGAYLETAALIYRDELCDADMAIVFFERALDALFHKPDAVPADARERCFRPFAALDALLTEQRDWAQQRLSYRAMIRRLAPGDPALPMLWHSLGEVCRTRLRDYRAAVEAFEVADALEPGNPDRKTIPAELRQLMRRR